MAMVCHILIYRKVGISALRMERGHEGGETIAKITEIYIFIPGFHDVL
jgi:hypothetical protein